MNREATLSDVLSDVDIAIVARDYNHAIALTNELLTTYPDAIGVWRAKARAYEATSQTLSAAESFGRVLDFLPSDHDAMSALARALVSVGNVSEARVWARQALDYLPLDREPILQQIASSSLEQLDTLQPIGSIGATGSVGAQTYTPDKSSLLLKTALAQTRAGLLDRGIAAFRQVVIFQPDRIDAKVALAQALWTNNARIAAADISTSILDEQPDCLNAHLILLQFWRAACAPHQEKYHLDAIERIDPDHRETAQLLGTRSPLAVTEAPATRPAALTEAAKPAEEDAQSRADWVDNLVAAASSAPKPLERDDHPNRLDDGASPTSSATTAAPALTAADAGIETIDGTDLANDAIEDPSDIEPVTHWEWVTNEAAEDIEDGFNLPWLSMNPSDASGGFVPSKPPRATPDAKDGVPEQIEAWEWHGGNDERAGDALIETEGPFKTEKAVINDTKVSKDTVDNRQLVSEREANVNKIEPEEPGIIGQVVEATPVPTDMRADPATVVTVDMPEPPLESGSAPALVTNNLNELMNEAQRALSEARLTDAAIFFKKIIPLLRGRPLDALIAELLAATKAQPSKALFDVLGLAYARKRDLPSALEAYRMAMAFDE